MIHSAISIRSQQSVRCFASLLLLVGLAAADGVEQTKDPAANQGDANVAFVRDVQPIFVKRCYACHGPDEQEGGLRLDIRRHALEGGDGGPVIMAGNSSESRLIEVVVSDDEDERMPLGEKPLDAGQIAALKRWIDAGANWPDEADGDPQALAARHWAFQPIRRPDIPTSNNTSWSRNEIDTFVLLRLEQEGIKPSPEADRYTLVRRLYLDLIGLPPTPEEVHDFLNDERPDAYERLVDRLLSSPRYGERWARRWLDLARYADTNGYEKDRPRSIWPYRDWVIRALNSDMPFDQFTIEQIAGDMLPDPTLDQLIATGFHRNTMINEEGGIDVAEFRFHSIVDRVATTGTTWLGLTIGCAQCHSHKYDPISQREYYQFFALLNNADEPDIDMPDPGVARRREEIQSQIAALEADLTNRFPVPEDDDQRPIEIRRREHLNVKFAEWREQATTKSHRWTKIAPTSAVSLQGATLTLLPDDSVLVTGDKPNQDTYVVELPLQNNNVTALRLEALPHESLPEGGPGRAPLFATGDFHLSEFKIAAHSEDSVEPVEVQVTSASHSYAQAGRSAEAALDGKDDTGWAVKDRVGEAHHAVFAFEMPDDQTPSKLIVTLRQHNIHQMTLGRFRLSVTGDAPPIAASGFPAEIEQLLTLSHDKRTDEQNITLKQYYLSIAPELAEEHKRLAELRRSLPQFPTTMVMQERLPQHARTTRIHKRGEFLQPTDPVEPDVPSALPSLPPDSQRDRLALAQWLVDRRNPLTARVVMNRHWQAFFGRGLVETLEDFGTQGTPPTHPLLLDWLASHFMDSGWSLKQMHRLIVTSATYRQSSAFRPELVERDPQNELLARAERFRLDAEAIRDTTLSCAGLLTDRIGGPSVFPPQPPGVTDLSYGKLEWETSTGADRYRRGLYTYLKRTSPYAPFSILGAPSGEACTARRPQSNTPLEALVIMNNDVTLDASQALAREVMQHGGTSANERIAYVIKRCLARPPRDQELNLLQRFFNSQLKQFAAASDVSALKLSEIAGVEVADSSEDLPELAAWTVIARIIFNLDEFLNRH